MTEDRWDSIHVGDEAEIFHTITAADVDAFTRLTGDSNPLHVDEGYAADTTFKRRVVHGMLTASFISTMIGTKLPGEGALWFEQTTRFLAPVWIGERIRVWAKVRHRSEAQRLLVIETVVYGEDGRRVIEGEGKVKVLKREGIMKAASTEEPKGAVIISGASRGIGAAIARALASDGYPVVINYLHSDAAARETADGITANGGNALLYRADISDAAAVRAMVEATLSRFGVICGIVNNACGVLAPVEFTTLAWENVQTQLDVQLKGAFNLTQAVLPHMLERKSGVVVTMSSVYADNVPPAKLLHYTTAKAALAAFSRSIAVEYGHLGIRSNCVSPGMTLTDLAANVPEKTKMVTKMQTPLRRLATPEDIAGTVSFLFGKGAAFMTGQNLRVCGGIVMP